MRFSKVGVEVHFKVHTRYFYSRLNEQEKKIYNKILEGWLNYKTDITLFGTYANVNFQVLLKKIYDDNPELFYIDNEHFSLATSAMRTIVSMRLKYDVKTCETMKAGLFNLVEKVNKLCAGSKDKLKVIHDFIIDNVSYSHDIYAPNTHDVYGALVNGSAVCEGYARAFKLLCDSQDIACMIVIGTAVNDGCNPEKHAWNMVKIGRNTYHIDPTWNCTTKRLCGVSIYYAVSDDLIGRNHRWQETDYPKCCAKGNVETRIKKINGPQELETFLYEMSKSKQKKGVIEFNRVFESQQDVMIQIKNIIESSGRICVASFGTVYLKNLNCVIVKFDY